MKKIKYLIFSLILLMPVLSLNAQTIKEEDVPNSTYIIGTHMFTRDINEETDYEGKLTTQLIMLASRTIEGNKIEDMVILYKNPRGKWVNAMTGQATTAPNTFMINYENKASKIMYGDANEDGKINALDALVIGKYISGTGDLTSQGLVNADINADDKVNKIDYDLIRRAWFMEFADDYDLSKGPIKIKTVSATFKTADTIIYERLYTLVTDVDREIEIDDPKKEGYKFDGWYIEGTDTKVENPYYSADKDMIYEARFIKDSYKIKTQAVDQYSPDVIITVYNVNDIVSFKEIRYEDDVVLCTSVNPTVYYGDLKNINTLKVELEDGTIVTATVE